MAGGSSVALMGGARWVVRTRLSGMIVCVCVEGCGCVCKTNFVA